MILDHAAIRLFPEYPVLHVIGRIAFPIYAFLIVEGFFRTRDVGKYMRNLLVCALLSEIPFDLATAGTVLEAGHQNTLFTLFLGVLLLYLYEKQYRLMEKIFCVVTIMLLADILRLDYGAWGILMIFCFYLFRDDRIGKIVSVTLINVFLFGSLQSYAVLALFPICMYNGKKGRSMKYFFYAAYPLHLLLLYLIGMIR